MAEPGGGTVAYVMSRFPKLTETFVLYEMVAVEELGWRVQLYPLLREREQVVHAEARPFIDRAHYLPFLSPAILASQWYWLRRRPRAYLAALFAVLRHTFGSRNFLLGGIGIFPKVAHAARQMREGAIDHIHCHFANHPALAGFVIHRLTGIPFSFAAHGSDLHVDRHMLCQKLDEAAFAVTISRDNRALMASTCPALKDKVTVIHCGVDTTVFRPAARGDRQNLEIVCIGSLHAVKGQAHLIDALALLDARGVEFGCRFVGEGKDRAALEERIAAAGLSDRVSLVGGLTRRAIAALLADADVLVAPSVPTPGGKREGIPVVLMEAMSAGVAVVASRLSGIPELVEDGRTGILVTPGDAAGIAAALVQLQADPELRARLGRAAREKVIGEFDVRRNAARLIATFAQADRR